MQQNSRPQPPDLINSLTMYNVSTWQTITYNRSITKGPGDECPSRNDRKEELRCVIAECWQQHVARERPFTRGTWGCHGEALRVSEMRKKTESMSEDGGLRARVDPERAKRQKALNFDQQPEGLIALCYGRVLRRIRVNVAT